MKQETMLLIGAAAAVLLILNRKSSPAGVLASTTKEISQPSGAAFANGWRYFDDGTSIDPMGRYWKGGQIIYSPIGS